MLVRTQSDTTRTSQREFVVGSLRSASAIPARAAKQCSIAATNQFCAVTGEADGNFPDRVADPGRCIDFVQGEEMFGDDPVDGSSLARIDGAEHLARSLMPLRSHPRIRCRAFATHRLPETLDGGQSVGRQFIKHDEHTKRTGVINIGQGHVVGLVLNSKPDQASVMLDDCVGLQIVNADTEITRRLRSAYERERGWIDLRGPENRLYQRGIARVCGEIATPIARQTSVRRLRSVAPQPLDRDMLVYNRDFDARTPKRDRRVSTRRCTHRQLPTANPYPRTSSNASAQF